MTGLRIAARNGTRLPKPESIRFFPDGDWTGVVCVEVDRVGKKVMVHNAKAHDEASTTDANALAFTDIPGPGWYALFGPNMQDWPERSFWKMEIGVTPADVSSVGKVLYDVTIEIVAPAPYRKAWPR